MNDDDEEARRRIAECLRDIFGFDFVAAAYSADDIARLKDLGRNPPRVIRNRVRCRKCDTIIESTHVHDYKTCKCGAVFVDGGHSYQRIGGNAEDWENLSEYGE